MAKPRKTIITCAVTGAIHTPSMSPHLPVSASEIAAVSVTAPVRVAVLVRASESATEAVSASV